MHLVNVIIRPMIKDKLNWTDGLIVISFFSYFWDN